MMLLLAWTAFGLGALGCVAQDVAARVPTELDVLLVGVREGALKQALTKWQEMKDEVTSRNRLHVMSVDQLTEVFSEPARVEAVLTMLNAAPKLSPEEARLPGVHGALYGAVRAAIYGKRPEVVPALEAMANSEVKEVRDLVADGDLYLLTTDPPISVQLAALKKEASVLPTLRKGDSEWEGSWGDFRGHLDSYVGNVPTELRMAAQPVMKTALERIDSWKAWWWMKMEFDNMMMKKRVTGAELVRQSEERSRFQGKTSWQREGSAVLWRVLAGLAVCGVVAAVGYRSLKFEV